MIVRSRYRLPERRYYNTQRHCYQSRPSLVSFCVFLLATILASPVSISNSADIVYNAIRERDLLPMIDINSLSKLGRPAMCPSDHLIPVVLMRH